MTSDEARRLVDEARARGIVLRLLGGVAVEFHCPSASDISLRRSYPDLDFFGIGKQGRLVRKLFTDAGYQPNQRFNALHGDTRLIFDDPANQRTVDVFFDVFHMCHTLRIGKRLTLDDYTIPIADLLLTKLQIVEINEKDVRDIIAILHDHNVVDSHAEGEKEEIDANYLAGLSADDWGLCHTITLTLKKILGLMAGYNLTADEKATVESRIDRMLTAIEAAPKSARWRLRAVVGERKRWYDLPEIPIRTQRVQTVLG